MHFVQGLLMYELCGLAWYAFNLWHPQVGHLVRERWAEAWRTNPRGRRSMVLAFAVWLQLWPAAVIWTLMPASWTSKLNDYLGRIFRREYLDRDGLLEPQMPAPRAMPAEPGPPSCHLDPSHGTEFMTRDVWGCNGCGRQVTSHRCAPCVDARMDECVYCSSTDTIRLTVASAAPLVDGQDGASWMTVGQLRKILAPLPDDMPIACSRSPTTETSRRRTTSSSPIS